MRIAVKTGDNCWSVIRIPSAYSVFALFELTLHLRGQKAGSLAGIQSVCQVCGGHDQSTVADHVAHGAEHLDLALGVVGDLAVVLQVASKSEEHHTLDLVLDVVVELLNGVVDDSTSLTAGRQHVPKIPTAGRELYLYPPATILVFGHLLDASLNILTASPIAPVSVFWGRAFCNRPPV